MLGETAADRRVYTVTGADRLTLPARHGQQ